MILKGLVGITSVKGWYHNCWCHNCKGGSNMNVKGCRLLVVVYY
jgi:hypothetical protein